MIIPPDCCVARIYLMSYPSRYSSSRAFSAPIWVCVYFGVHSVSVVSGGRPGTRRFALEPVSPGAVIVMRDCWSRPKASLRVSCTTDTLARELMRAPFPEAVAVEYSILANVGLSLAINFWQKPNRSDGVNCGLIVEKLFALSVMPHIVRSQCERWSLSRRRDDVSPENDLFQRDCMLIR